MTEINYVRNLSGACLTVVRGAPQLGLPIPPRRKQWEFCTTRSLLAACRRRVEPSCSAIPPDWCRRQPRVSRLGPADQAARLSETPVAFAGAGRASTETVIAFAGEKWAFLACFSVALVLLVSTVDVQGCAVVMVVSSSPRHGCPCAKKFALLGLMVGVCAKKFAQRTKNGRKSVVCGVLGEFFRGNAGGGVVLGEFFRANRCCAQVL